MKTREKSYSVWTMIAFFFLSLIPHRGKRFILLVTLYAQLVERGIFHEETLEKLNKTLCLASSADALVLPWRVSKKVWDTKELDEVTAHIHAEGEGVTCMPFKEAEQTAEELLALVPPWLQYGKHEEMMRDVMSLLYCQPLKTL